LDLTAVPSYFIDRLGKALLAPGSHVSLASLTCALLIACAIIAAKRYRKSRRIHARTLIRALFPKSIVLSRSTLTDFGYLYFNIFVFGIVFGWALLSYEMLSRTIVDQLTALLMPPAPLPALVSRTVITVMLFLAYELGYWLNHYLSHRIPFL
jgi:sterol desaturase/sphingolipid hydroxylase (fatty acid hydroxylase superfamily)